MKKIVITGAAGEVGLNLLALLSKDINKRYIVVAIDKNKHNLNLIKRLFPQVEVKHADLSEEGRWVKAFKKTDTVIQLQAQISSPNRISYIKNNVISVRNVVKCCKRYKIRHLIHVSSSVVISVAKDMYANTKREGEKIVRESGLPYTILRPTLMYGCFDIKHLGFLVKIFSISPIFPIPGSGKYIRQPLFVEDFCKIIIRCIERGPKNRIYNISGKEKIYFIDLIRIMSKELGKKRLFLHIPVPIFIFLLKIYGLLTGKIHYVPEQLKALMAGDIFPVTNWDRIFNIRYTPYKEGVRKMINSPYYIYNKYMKK